MDGHQLSFCFESSAPDAIGEKFELEKRNACVEVLPSWASSVDQLLAIAQRTPGWNFRENGPQFATLDGGCSLVAMPPWLWRRRIGVKRPSKPCVLVRFPPRLRLSIAPDGDRESA